MHLPIALAAVIALQDVTIIDTINGKTLQARTVVIRDNKIAAITSAPPKDAQVVNGKGKFLIPGLWDMHMHLRGGQETLPDNAAMLKLFVANGVTSVREMGGDLGETVFTWKKEIQEGKRVGPRIFSSGPKLDGPKPSWPGSIAVSNPEDGRKAVQQVHQMGADFVKLYFDAIELPTLQAITAEAKKLKLTVAAHGMRNLTVREFVGAGVRDIQHARYYVLPGGSIEERAIAKEYGERRGTANPMTNAEWVKRMNQEHSDAQERAMFQLFVKDKVWVTPTLMVGDTIDGLGIRNYDRDPRRKFVPARIWKSWDTAGRRKPPSEETRKVYGTTQKKVVELVPRMQRTGIHLLAGSDSGYSNNFVFPGWSLHEEISMLRDAGLSNAEALQTATVNAARFFKLDKKYGSIGKGKAADLVLLDANPLIDIRNTQKIAGVVLHGQWLDRKALDNLMVEAGNTK